MAINIAFFYKRRFSRTN